MEKITLKALQLAGFQNADMIAKIISYVPNPRVATEMLLGIYDDKPLDISKRFRKYRYDRNNMAEIVSIDELGDTVTYKTHEQKTKQVWYLTKEDRDNKVYVTVRPEKSYDYSHIPTDGFTTREDTTSLSSFNENWNQEISTEQAFQIWNDWDNYGKPQYEVSDELLENELPF